MPDIALTSGKMAKLIEIKKMNERGNDRKEEAAVSVNHFCKSEITDEERERKMKHKVKSRLIYETNMQTKWASFLLKVLLGTWKHSVL